MTPEKATFLKAGYPPLVIKAEISVQLQPRSCVVKTEFIHEKKQRGKLYARNNSERRAPSALTLQTLHGPLLWYLFTQAIPRKSIWENGDGGEMISSAHRHETNYMRIYEILFFCFQRLQTLIQTV